MPTIKVTALHAEVFEIIQFKKILKNDPTKIAKLSKITNEPSRVRLAIDDLKKIGAFKNNNLMGEKKPSTEAEGL